MFTPLHVDVNARNDLQRSPLDEAPNGDTPHPQSPKHPRAGRNGDDFNVSRSTPSDELKPRELARRMCEVARIIKRQHFARLPRRLFSIELCGTVRNIMHVARIAG